MTVADLLEIYDPIGQQFVKIDGELLLVEDQKTRELHVKNFYFSEGYLRIRTCEQNWSR